MKHRILGIAFLLFAGMLLPSCGGSASPSPVTGDPTMTQSDSTPTPGSSAASPPSTPSTPASSSTPPPSGTYPKMGHAPDYSWIAGKVAITKIQSGCVYIRTEEPPDVETPPTPGPGGVVSSTAVNGSVSQPLRDITPSPPDNSASQGPKGPSFVPAGNGWDQSKVQDGEYVVLFGHPMGPNEPHEMCPGGTPYMTDSMQANP